MCIRDRSGTENRDAFSTPSHAKEPPNQAHIAIPKRHSGTKRVSETQADDTLPRIRFGGYTPVMLSGKLVHTLNIVRHGY